MLDGFDLTGRRALVTGASRGIGRAIALGLGRCGAKVAVHYASREAAAREVLAELGGRGCVVGGDLADDDAPARILDQTVAALGGIDILVLNASVQYSRTWKEFDRGEFDRQVAVNFRSVFEMIHRAAPAMMECRWGRIVTVGSVQQYRPYAMMVPYGALKNALEQMVRNLARQLGPHGVTVNNLVPGIMATERIGTVYTDPEVRAKVGASIPVRRIGEPEDCAGAAVLLCSDAGAYITGTDLIVDGGYRLP
ncbi:MAG: SDR family oxidoreductase [Planctomycetes bacterium]|nr:SDR family oxidoreductase [Planctomycetota bacterium]